MTFNFFRTCLAATAILCIASTAAHAESQQYKNDKMGISVTVPDTAQISESQHEDALRVNFAFGNPPFSTNIVLKELPGFESYDAFLADERKKQKDGGYTDQMSEKAIEKDGTQIGIEFIRRSRFGELHYFTFPIKRGAGIAGITYMVDSNADPDGKTLATFEHMKQTLVVE